MRVIQGMDIEFRKPRTRHREGAIEFKHLAHGEAGSPQNYEFSVVRNDGRYQAPRHKHNFDQLRLVLRGTFGDGRAHDLKTGQVGYYPEGVPYLIDANDADVLLLQFGGASGSGFTHYEQIFQAYSELSKLGEFRDGVFFRSPESNAGPGVKRNQDGYEAIWQHINGRPVAYPRPRYAEPVHMDPDNFDWVPVPDQGGVEQRVLGIFTERMIEVGQLRIKAGSTAMIHADRAPRLLFLMEGAAEGESAWNTETTAELDIGEMLSLTASTDTVLYAITLPFFEEVRNVA